MTIIVALILAALYIATDIAERRWVREQARQDAAMRRAADRDIDRLEQQFAAPAADPWKRTP